MNEGEGNDVSFAFGVTDHKQRSLPLTLARAGVIRMLKIAGRAVKVLKAPPAAILQNLNLCFLKR